MADVSALSPQPSRRDEGRQSALTAQGYTALSILIRKRYCTVYRGRRISDGAPVLLKSYTSRSRLFRSRAFLHHLSGTGVASEILDFFDADRLMVVTDDDEGVLGEALLLPTAKPDFRSNVGAFLRIACALASALNLLHSKRVIHAAVCNAHYVVSHDAATGNAHVRFIEYYGALFFDETEDEQTHAVWQRLPLAYVSPEQTGQVAVRVDYRTDLYSLGVALYELCTGRVPCAAGSVGTVRVHNLTDSPKRSTDLVHEVLFTEPVPASTVNAKVPPQISAIISRLLAKQPERRYQSAYGLGWDLARCLEEWNASGEVRAFPLASVDPAMVFRPPTNCLVGRASELQLLQERCDAARTSSRPQCVVIEGPAGIGKNALLGAVLNERQKFLCISGKFEESRQHVPYDAFAQAFTQLARRVSVLPPEEVSAMHDRLRRNLTPANVQLLLHAFPCLDKILVFAGKSGANAAQDTPLRFAEAVAWLLAGIASPSKPLILVLDDMQWADVSSCRLWQAILSTEITGLIAMTALRAFAAVLEALRVDNAPITHITLNPLTAPAVAELIGSCVRMDPALSTRLGTVLTRKTLGYPFFVLRYLKLLYDSRDLYFDPQRGLWECNIDKVATMELTINAAELVVAEFRRVDPEMLRPLLVASCCGGEFSVDLLAAMTNLDDADLAAHIDAFVERAYITPVCPGVYKFCHDHVRTVAYSMLSLADQERTHLELARTMLGHCATEPDLTKNLFEILGHFSKSNWNRVLPSELDRLVELYNAAAEKALAASSYATAASFATDGIKALERIAMGHHWVTHQTLAFELHLKLVKSLHWNGEPDKGTAAFRVLIANTTSRVPRAEAYLSMLTFATMADLGVDELLRLATEFSAIAGVRFPDAPWTDAWAAARLRGVARVVEALGIEKLESLPLCTEPLPQICLSALIPMAPAISVYLAAALACDSVERALSEGLTDHSLIGFAFFAMFACYLGALAPVRATQMGAALVRACDRFPGSVSRSIVYQIYGHTLHTFTHHPSEGQPLLALSNKYDLDAYAYWSACISMALTSELHVIGDRHLDDALHAIKRSARTVSPRHAADVFHLAGAARAFASELQLGEAAFSGPTSRSVWADLEEQTTRRRTPLSAVVLACYKSALLYLLGRSQECVTIARSVFPQLHVVLGLLVAPYLTEPCFILALLDLAHQGVAALADEILAATAAWEKRASLSRGNLGGVMKLIAARTAEVLNKDLLVAAQLYDEAVTLTRASRLPLWEGVACLLAGNNIAAIGLRAAGAHFYDDASRVFADFGAATLVARVRREHGVDSPLQHSSPSASSAKYPLSPTSSLHSLPAFSNDTPPIASTAQLDAYAVLQLSSTIASHVDFEKLADEVMRILLENTGADYACMCCSHDLPKVQPSAQRWRATEALSDVAADRNTAEIIRHVGTFHETLVIDNAFADARFTAPSSFEYASGIKSVLCAPVLTNAGCGVIYLENRSVVGAFTPARKALVEAVVPQFAIGIERSNLISKLKQATEELELKNKRLERADTHKDQFLAVTTHELRTPLHGIISATSLLIESQLTDEQREYGAVILSASRSLLTLVDDILDLTRIRASKLRIELRSCKVLPVVETVFEVLSAAAGEKGVDLAYEIEGEEAYRTLRSRLLVSDPQRLQQVLMNLMSNAIKFTTRGHVLLTISVIGSGAQTKLRFAVQDTGKGIPPDQIPRLFHMFSQLDTPNASRYDGFGVGLFICHSVVQLLGGTIEAHSDGVSGSTFVVVVPTPVSAFAVDDGEEAPKASDSPKVLVWPTYAHTGRIIVSELKRAGIEAAAETDEAAFQHAWAAATGPVCVAVDLANLDAVRRLQPRLRRPVALIVLSSYVAWRQLANKEGLTPLFKPLQHRRIACTIRAACAESAKGVVASPPVVRHLTPISSPRCREDACKNCAKHATPATPSPLQPPAERSDASNGQAVKLKRVLVVEDNLLNAKMLVKMLGSLYEVECAVNGLEAVEAVKRRAPDLVLMDVQMPVMDGIAASQEIRRLGHHMPIIAATASLTDSDRELAFGAGMNDVLAKPFAKQVVLNIVNRHMATAASGR